MIYDKELEEFFRNCNINCRNIYDIFTKIRAILEKHNGIFQRKTVPICSIIKEIKIIEEIYKDQIGTIFTLMPERRYGNKNIYFTSLTKDEIIKFFDMKAYW